ncbi:exoribonuclease II [Plasmodium gonderi]|uniref:Exoribonuclease II n=1 Tax=Plasmodium gonderi TaxID=77519 RepID=A0A1Y1JFL1_PLAGO|nr:exoribonuclease II [Plasmodium gonderi]GAW80125.1 exoribonuclease II [Plasmodium gonderi]
MFFLKNVRRYCFYSKIYENIRIVKQVKLQRREKQDGEKSPVCKSEQTQSSVTANERKNEGNFTTKDLKSDKQFYEKIYNKIKQKNVKLEEKEVEIPYDSLEGQIREKFTVKNEPFEKDQQVENEKKISSINRRRFNESPIEGTTCVIEKYYEKGYNTYLKEKKKDSRLTCNWDLASNKSKNIKDEKHLKLKNNYLKSKDMYLKVKDEYVSGYKGCRNRQEMEKTSNIRSDRAISPLQSCASNGKKIKRKGKLEEKDSCLTQKEIILGDLPFRNEQPMKTKMSEYNVIENESQKKVKSLPSSKDNQRNIQRHLKYIYKSKLNKDLQNGKDYKEHNNTFLEAKLEKTKNTKGLSKGVDETVDKYYILVEYEKYWEEEKIDKILQIQKDSKKILKNKLFKGVLCVSPFDTSKCVVVSEEDSIGLSKKNVFSIYGYISRNRALNDDIVYAYTARRRINRFGDSENLEEILETNQIVDTISVSEKEDEKMENFCRVVNIVERKNTQIVCTLNYQNIKESICNTFGEKGVSSRLKNTDPSKMWHFVKNAQDEGVNYNCDENNIIIESTLENPFRQTIKKGAKGNEYLCAKIQPLDTRLPCFIYDSFNFMINELFCYLKKKKMNLYLLVKFNKWDEHQINPSGSITTILGNEKNFFGLIYFFIHFYKIHFHIYNKDDMSYLRSMMEVSSKMLSTFENRNFVSLNLQGMEGGTQLGIPYETGPLTDAETDVEREASSVTQHRLKMAYLRNIQENNKCIEKYMLKSFFKNREIITDLDIFTIDPLNAKDLDDALSIEFITNNCSSVETEFEYRIGVHISDVSFFVHPDSYYDRAASKVCNTIYMDFLVIHMLPRILSEEICSLNTEGEKLSFSVFFHLDNRTNPYDITKRKNGKDVKFKKTLIKSKYKLNYDVVEDFLDEVYFHIENVSKNLKEMEKKILINGNFPLNYFLLEFEKICNKYNINTKVGSDIFRLYLLSRMLKEKNGRKSMNTKSSLLFSLNESDLTEQYSRDRVDPIMIEEMEKDYYHSNGEGDNGIHDCTSGRKPSMEYFLKKYRFQMMFNETNMENIHVEKMEYKKKSHMLIEEMMILTNFLVADKITNSNKLGILRIHENTSEDIKNNLLHIIDYNTYNKINETINIEKSTINDILTMCEEILNENQFLCLQHNILKYYKEAIYIPYGEGEKKTDHFGLVLSKYIHFTSPIRRYIDIITHRILTNILEYDEKSFSYSYEDLKKICDQCNIQKKKTDEAQIHLKNALLNRYLIYLNDSYQTEQEVVDKTPEMSTKNGEVDNSEDVVSCTLHTEAHNSYDNTTEQYMLRSKENNCMYEQNTRKEIRYTPPKKNEQEETHRPIKKYFYRRDGVISFPTEAYIQEIVITKSTKENICLNILNNNYIDIGKIGNTDGVVKLETYTSYIFNPSKESNGINNYMVERSASISDDIKLMNYRADEITSLDNNREENAKCKFKKNQSDSGKLKNAIVFYVPLLETEKSISDSLLNLTFQYIFVLYRENNFIYDLSKGVLYRLCGDTVRVNGQPSDSQNKLLVIEATEGTKEESGKNRNQLVFKILKKINNFELNVKYELLKLNDKKDFQNIYNVLYIQDVFFKRDENNKSDGNSKIGLQQEKCINENNKRGECLIKNPTCFVGDKREMEQVLKEGENENVEEYEIISRFQKKEIYIIPGSQLWTLRLA